jgi:hypothetical protein
MKNLDLGKILRFVTIVGSVAGGGAYVGGQAEGLTERLGAIEYRLSKLEAAINRTAQQTGERP